MDVSTWLPGAGFRRICRVDGTVSWSGLRHAAGYLQLWVHEAEEEEEEKELWVHEAEEEEEEEKYHCIDVYQNSAGHFEQVCLSLFNLWITRSVLMSKLLWALRYANVSLRCRHLS